jgi:hypothetical protein
MYVEWGNEHIVWLTLADAQSSRPLMMFRVITNAVVLLFFLSILKANLPQLGLV